MFQPTFFASFIRHAQRILLGAILPCARPLHGPGRIPRKHRIRREAPSDYGAWGHHTIPSQDQFTLLAQDGGSLADPTSFPDPDSSPWRAPCALIGGSHPHKHGRGP